MCEKLGADYYIKAIEGVELYHEEKFRTHRIMLFLWQRKTDFVCESVFLSVCQEEAA